ncbi:MAG: prepilin-type N-terminal cleavage/methylation domain-containing protein [Candidatus Omnitrophota bacterium]
MSLITRPKRCGFTLVELIIVMAIMGIFMTSLFAVFKNSLDAWKKSEAKLAVYQNARTILDQMSREIQTAVFDPANGVHAKGYEKGSGIKTDSQGDEFFFVGIVDAGDADLAEIGYWIDSGHVLRRHYDVAEKGEIPALDFNFTTPDSSKYSDDELGFDVTDLQFKFHYRTTTLEWAATENANWDSSSDNIANLAANGLLKTPDGLPNGVEIEITIQDSTQKEAVTFSTLVYIPQSK